MEAKGHESEHYQTLGENVIPEKYTLRFKPNLKTFRYECSETISVKIKKRTTEISLNASEIDVKSASILSDGAEIKARVSANTENQTITLRFEKAVAGSAGIRIEFIGINNSNLYGFYRSKYTNGNKTGYILTSQFEAANARHAFPCFDEPSFKATFSLSMVVDRDLDCISNMPVSRIVNLGKKKEVHFMETPRMSSYLLYLGVGNYEYVKGRVGKTEVRVITTPGNKHLAKLPMEYSKSFIKFFENYFGIKYPLPKVDFIAIPDFSAGAMENWGAITFRETALLADKKSSLATLQRVAEVIAHELAHQWFGDLVTMKWWNDLWLNESFATFMSYKAMDAVFPGWKMIIEYKQDVIATAFAADQLKSTHPISVPVKVPSDIDQIFDEISYDKGGTVLNMIEDYVGKEIFRGGLHRYLKKHSYSNATKFDLWRAIDEEAKSKHKSMDLYNVAGYWIDKPGYPSINVKRVDGGVEIKQERYFLLSNMSDSSVWPIPVSYVVSGKEHNILFDKKSARITVDKNQWIKLNFGQNGLYRVAYGDEDASRLGELIRSKKLSGTDSWGIEHDIFARSRSGRAKADDYLEFVEKYCLNGEYPLSADVLGGIGFIYDMLYDKGNTRSKELLVMYTNELINKLGWERRKRESTFDTMLRSAAILKSGIAGYTPTSDRAVALFNSHMGGVKEIDPNIRGAIYYLAAWTQGDKLFEVFKERYKKERLPEERIRLLKSLAFFSSKELISRSLNFSMSEEVRLQDSFMIPALSALNPFGRDLILDWTEKNWDELKKRYASGTHMLGRYVDNLGVLRTREDLNEVIRFFNMKENYRPDIKHSLENTIEQIEANIRFNEANR